jgi:hypothetical protein
MFSFDSNQTLLLCCLVLVIGSGIYLTYFHQQGTISSLEKSIEKARAENEKIRSLQADRDNARDRLQTARRRWRTQYKQIPPTVSSPEVLSYLTQLTETGFQQFDLSSSGTQERDGYSVYTYSAEGKAFYTNFYQFIWRIENSRPFYRIRGLSLNYLEERESGSEEDPPSLDVLVSFSMDIQAIFGAATDLQPPGSSQSDESKPLPVAAQSGSPPLPPSVGPNRTPQINPFYPLVFEDVPPNQFDRLNIETSKLLSIVENKAIFQTDDGLAQVEEGDPVYLGRIEKIVPSEGRVVARLNRGGIVDRVERTLSSDSPLRLKTKSTSSPDSED